MANISLTGGNGFVGKNLVPHLNKQGHSVKTISREDLNHICVDIIKDCDAIIHLAGKAHDLRKSSNPEEYYRVNFELTKQLYDIFLRSDAKKFVFISSVKSSADTVAEILEETDFPNPQTDYGKSKLMAEQYIQAQVLPKDKFYYILRPCMIHGPGNKGNLNLLYKVVEKKIPYPLAAFDNKRSFLSISNLNVVIESLISQIHVRSGVYNVADDEPLSTNQVIELIGVALGFKAKLWKIRPGLIELIAKLGNILHLPLNSERLKKLTESYVVSNRKIKNALSIKDLPISSTDGLLNTIKSFNIKKV